MDNTSYTVMLHKLAIKYKRPVKEIKNIVESQFEFIADEIKQLNFKEIESEEELKKLKTNFNVRYLFTLYANWNLIRNINKSVKLKQNKNGEIEI